MTTRSRLSRLALFAAVIACMPWLASPSAAQTPSWNANPPSPDPRVGLAPGLWDAGQAAWNMRLVANARPSQRFMGATNSDLAFLGKYAIQGSYDGYQIWDISNPAAPKVAEAYFCPASQSDVSVYKNLLIVSAEAPSARLDCGAEGVKDTVSHERIRGIRIFDISDISKPKYLANVQTCRGSHTHSLLVDPKDPNNVYVYISGSSSVRSPNELPGCVNASPDKDPNSAKFRIEVIKVPLAHPEQAAIVSSPRIFNDLAAPPTHGNAPEDARMLDSIRKAGGYIVHVFGMDFPLQSAMVNPMLDSMVKARGGSGAPTHADSAALHEAIQGMVDKMISADESGPPGPTQCHDITLYPAIGLAGGACEGYGMLLDIHDPAHPVRVDAVADSNFSYWHSATFNNDGTKVLFSDEWGGGSQPKCRASDPKQWGGDALFTIDASHKMHFQGYYKMPAAQTSLENCVAHNGSLIPIPGRDVMVQAWYQGGISVFDWTDPAHAREIAFFDRGPVNGQQMVMGGSWSVYWYNGELVSSEIARGLDVFELTPSPLLTQNEIDAAKTVHLDYLNTQGQPKFVWPASFALARAYLDQIERDDASMFTPSWFASKRQALADAEKATGAARRDLLNKLAGDSTGGNAVRMQRFVSAVRDLAR